MGDRNGAALQPGDWVCYQTEGDGMVLATVLSELDGGAYLIELEPRSLVSVGEVPDHLGSAFDHLGGLSTADVEVLEVRGEALVSVG